MTDEQLIEALARLLTRTEDRTRAELTPLLQQLALRIRALLLTLPAEGDVVRTILYNNLRPRLLPLLPLLPLPPRLLAAPSPPSAPARQQRRRRHVSVQLAHLGIPSKGWPAIAAAAAAADARAAAQGDAGLIFTIRAAHSHLLPVLSQDDT